MLLCASIAQAANVPARIAAVDDGKRIALSNAVSPRAIVAHDLGAAAGSRTLTMSLRFSHTPAQQSALTQLLADQQNPASSRYHHWLTPEQFNAQFGLASSDIAKVTGWLQSQGFTVTETSRGGQFVRFTGTVTQANQAFRTKIERVSANGIEHIANLTPPSLPSSIAAVTTTITGLHDFTLHPHHTLSSIAKPMYTSSTGAHYLTPQDIYAIYNVSGLLSSSVNGTGVTIAVVGQADVQLSDIASFRSAAGLAANPPSVMLYGTDPASTQTASDVIESTFDLEYAGALAPSATTLFVTSTDVANGSITEAIDNDLAAIISDSYGDCEASIGTTDLAYYNDLLQQGAAEGITIIAPSGDQAATDCVTETPPTYGLQVDFPASSPWVTGVGGTSFVEGSGTYWSSTNGSGGGSATGYIPETVWNDSTSPSAIAGSGGGASLVFPKPSWQVGTGVPADDSRDVPDIALPASTTHDPYLFCFNGSCASGFSSGGQIFGGTSAGPPVFSGLMALVVQKQGGHLGVANNTLYALANSTYRTNVFNDVTSGNNEAPCTTGTTDCSSGGPIGYTATVGYDQATGWGSVNALNLVNDWSLVTPLYTSPAGLTDTLTNLTASASSVAAGTSVTLTATVASSVSTVTGTPTGTVTFTVDSAIVGTGTLTSGVATYSLNTSSLAAGTHKVQATYDGDGTFYGSKGAFTLTISAASSTTPDFTLTPKAVTLGVSTGAITQGIVYTVTATNGFTGTVNFDAIYSASANITKIFSATSVTITSTSPSATTTLALAAYTGGNVSDASHSNSFGWTATASGILFAGVIVLIVPTRRRRIPGLLLIAFTGVTLFSFAGCANNSTSSTPAAAQTNAAAGTYPISVTASSTINGTVVTHTATINLTVQ